MLYNDTLLLKIHINFSSDVNINKDNIGLVIGCKINYYLQDKNIDFIEGLDKSIETRFFKNSYNNYSLYGSFILSNNIKLSTFSLKINF